jgi:hypothetical protein
LKIRWELPSKLLEENDKTEIQLPSFKYDLPRLAGVPVPFSSKALALKIDDIGLENSSQALAIILRKIFMVIIY